MLCLCSAAVQHKLSTNDNVVKFKANVLQTTLLRGLHHMLMAPYELLVPLGPSKTCDENIQHKFIYKHRSAARRQHESMLFFF